MDYQFEQKGRRPIVIIAALLSLGMVGGGAYYEAPWYFLAAPGIAGLMSLVALIQNSHSGLKLDAQSLTLFKDNWQEVIPMATITGLRLTHFSDGQPNVWLDRTNAPPYRIPGYCFGSAEQLKLAFAAHGIKAE
jgi:hypothetical protein